MGMACLQCRRPCVTDAVFIAKTATMRRISTFDPKGMLDRESSGTSFSLNEENNLRQTLGLPQVETQVRRLQGSS
jgi:hypothetical protein